MGVLRGAKQGEGIDSQSDNVIAIPLFYPLALARAVTSTRASASREATTIP